ncbi:DUF4145 domain-containing protein [Bacillus nitratireducens]|uniref:DUF4145 domain-containing protein n=1 Tax=Bacillus nitratireducens TaxID=2026193 RepID=UPI002E1BBDD2|nr:DUF4145 domain-containing protein [Bacillus nitratireducens]
MNNEDIKPSFLLDVFQCPHCKCKTKHMWYVALGWEGHGQPIIEEAVDFYQTRIAQEKNRPKFASEKKKEDEKISVFSSNEWHVDMSICAICSEYMIWKDDKFIYPNSQTIEDPCTDMPEEVKHLYNEAREVVNLSPKSACALLRLAVERLLIEGLKCPSKNTVNDNINLLREEGKLSAPIDKALTAVRLVGNAAVHAGKINLDDKPEYAYTLFGLLNYIVDDLISRPARAEAFLQTIKS